MTCQRREITTDFLPLISLSLSLSLMEAKGQASFVDSPPPFLGEIPSARKDRVIKKGPKKGPKKSPKRIFEKVICLNSSKSQIF